MKIKITVTNFHFHYAENTETMNMLGSIYISETHNSSSRFIAENLS